jgi:YVTN family beta-propeller protein
MSLSQTKTASNETPRQNLLLVVNQGDRSMSLVDPEAGTQVGKVKTHGVCAHEVAVSPDRCVAYLPIYGNSGVGKPGTNGGPVEIVDLDRQAVMGSIDLGPARPHWVKFGLDGMLYVSAELDKAIHVVDPRLQKTVGSIPTGQPESHMVVMSHDGSRAYTANVGAGTVSVVDVATRRLLKIIPVAERVQRISMSIDGQFVFTADQKKPRLAIIDTATNEICGWITLPVVGYGTAPTLDGKWLLATMQSTDQVAVVDLAQMQVSRTIPVAADPVQILVRPDRPVAYVSCTGDGKVAAINLETWRVEKLIETGPGADGLAWLGKRP